MLAYAHDHISKWKYFPRYWPFVKGIHRWPVYSPHKGQWRVALMFVLRLNKRLSKHSRRRRFETPTPALWRHCNEELSGSLMLGIHYIHSSFHSICTICSTKVNNHIIYLLVVVSVVSVTSGGIFLYENIRILWNDIMTFSMMIN